MEWLATQTLKTSSSTGWSKNADGTWNYVRVDGSKAIGWFKEGSEWYYSNTSGVMQTGWVNDNGNWYYCNESGAMLTNTTVGEYVLGDNGALVKYGSKSESPNFIFGFSNFLCEHLRAG